MRPAEAPRRIAVAVISSYCWLKQAGLLPAYNCRFWPTCSAYAQEAIHTQGLIRGGWMALGRILRCRPGNPGGADPPMLYNYK